MSIYRRVLAYYRPFSVQTAIGLLLSLAAIGLSLLKPWPLKILIDHALGNQPLPAFLSGIGSHPSWMVLNVALLLLSFWTGYAEMAPEKLAPSNLDVIFCTITLVTTVVFSFGAVWYSISGARQQTLRRASWRRFSIDWWHEPLQCLFLSCCFAGAMAVGAAFRLPGTSRTGFWMFMFFVCLFLGLLIGQLGVYSVHRDRITST